MPAYFELTSDELEQCQTTMCFRRAKREAYDLYGITRLGRYCDSCAALLDARTEIPLFMAARPSGSLQA